MSQTHWKLDLTKSYLTLLNQQLTQIIFFLPSSGWLFWGDKVREKKTKKNTKNKEERLDVGPLTKTSLVFVLEANLTTTLHSFLISWPNHREHKTSSFFPWSWPNLKRSKTKQAKFIFPLISFTKSWEISSNCQNLPQLTSHLRW